MKKRDQTARVHLKLETSKVEAHKLVPISDQLEYLKTLLRYTTTG